jgi:23S rRNA pseudouridine2605 synthase
MRNRPTEHIQPQTLVKYLVGAGLGSRRVCAMLVRDGKVRVDGTMAPMLTQLVEIGARVEVDGAVVHVPTSRVLNIVLNKPAGYLSTVRDEHGRPTVMTLLPSRLKIPGLVPAGRLDMDSTGLLILTNDGSLVNRLTHPRYGIEKEYHVTLNSALSGSDLNRLETGVAIPGGSVKAKAARRLGPNRYAIILTEGRNREVRLMVDALGANVLHLNRVRVGNFRCDSLGVGKFQILDRYDIGQLQAIENDSGRRSIARNDKTFRGRLGKKFKKG